MQKRIIAISFISFLLFSAFSTLEGWKINSDKAAVKFVIKNAGLKVNGSFGDLKGVIIFDPAQPNSGKINASVAVNTVDTGIKMRDGNLVEEDYFDATKYPRISFTSTSIYPKGNAFEVSGTLRIKAVSKKVSIPFTFENQVFEGKLTIDRLDYGVGESSWVMGDEVKITFSIPVSQEG